MKEKVIKIELVPGGWSTTPRVVQKTGNWRTLRPVIDYDKCTGCGLCNIFCPEASVNMEDRRPEINYDYCKGCGVCGNECPVHAIEMVPEVGGD